MELALKILPELVSGRGTTRRVVEGQTRYRCVYNRAQHAVQITQNIARRNTQCFNASSGKPRVASIIPLREVPARMHFTVNLNGQPRAATEEIQNITSARMLTSKFQASWPFAQFTPQKNLWQRHFTAQGSRSSGGSVRRLGRNVPEHALFPSTMLRMVPLPETSSGRNLELSS